MAWWERYVQKILEKYAEQANDNTDYSYDDYYHLTGANQGPNSTAATRELAAYTALPDYLKKYFGGETSVAKGEALGGATLMEADLQRELNRLKYTDQRKFFYGEHSFSDNVSVLLRKSGQHSGT